MPSITIVRSDPLSFFQQMLNMARDSAHSDEQDMQTQASAAWKATLGETLETASRKSGFPWPLERGVGMYLR